MTVRKIKHILTAFVFCLILSASTIPVCASAVSASNEETGYVYVLDDSADFLTDSQENSLQKQLYDLTAYCNVAFVTTTGHSKSSTEDFAADYFDDVFGPHANGTIFVIDRCLNEIYLYSDGQAHKIITNSRARSITDNTYTYARDKDYYTCAYKVFAQIETLMQGKRIAEPMRYLCSALLAIVAALFLNLFFALWSSRSHKADRRQVMTGLYAQMQINNPRTQFIRQSRTYSPVSSGSSGGGHSGGGGGGGHSGGGGGHSI
jgi:beta-propeller domains of methanol dehydrogenase type